MSDKKDMLYAVNTLADDLKKYSDSEILIIMDLCINDLHRRHYDKKEVKYENKIEWSKMSDKKDMLYAVNTLADDLKKYSDNDILVIMDICLNDLYRKRETVTLKGETGLWKKIE